MAGAIRPRASSIKLPPHTGPVTLTFDLHNRTRNRGARPRPPARTRATPRTVGVLMMDNNPRQAGGRAKRIQDGSRSHRPCPVAAGPGGVTLSHDRHESILYKYPETESGSAFSREAGRRRIDGSATLLAAGRPIQHQPRHDRVPALASRKPAPEASGKKRRLLAAESKSTSKTNRGPQDRM